MMKTPRAGYAKTIASNESDMGSEKTTGNQSVVSAHTNGLMFKCFDSIYGAQRTLTVMKDHRSTFGGSQANSSRFG